MKAATDRCKHKQRSINLKDSKITSFEKWVRIKVMP